MFRLVTMDYSGVAILRPVSALTASWRSQATAALASAAATAKTTNRDDENLLPLITLMSAVFEGQHGLK